MAAWLHRLGDLTDRHFVNEKGFLLIAILVAVSITQAPLVLEYDTAAPPKIVATCIADHLRGRRLGINFVTLRPIQREVGPYWLVTVGEAVEIIVAPSPTGSNVKLKTKVFTQELSTYVGECRSEGDDAPPPSHQ